MLLVLFISSASLQSSTHAQNIDEEIKKEQEKLKKAQEDINVLQKGLTNTKNQIKNAEEGLPKLELEIKEIETQLELNQKELEFLKQEFELNKKLIAKLESDQKKSISSTYKEWRLNNFRSPFEITSRTKFIIAEHYGGEIFGVGNDQTNSLENKIRSLGARVNDFEELVNNLKKESEKLASKKAELEEQIKYFNAVIASDTQRLTGLISTSENIQRNIGNLLAEQKAAALKEKEILGGAPPPPVGPPPKPVENGFYITGKGRDLYQGHGVGMSQWGAYGAALANWKANDILTFYFSNTKIEKRGGNINVQGYGVMNSNTYVAGLGEVPSKACGTKSQAQSRPDKYVVDNPATLWDCWPEEAIKAQVIAARSYAMVAAQPICTTAACQVYAGHKDKQWAADETKDMVIVSTGSTHNGQIISAVYSSDNSQGNGTANNDTIWQNFAGDGTPHSYLRAKNDKSFATPTEWTNWTYQSQSYNLKSIYDMFKFVGSPNSSADQGTKNNVNNFINGTTSFTAIELERDPSGRVKKVWLTNQAGVKKSIGGWWFKNIWVNWQYDIGRQDYIYSQTFYINWQ